MATLLGAGFLGWAVADIARYVPAPTTTLGSLSFWPLRVEWVDLLGVLGVLVIVAFGLSRLNGLSLEAAERRTALVGQLRFAVTVQDLRTVIVLRRQLAEDRPRSRPWFRLPGRGRFTVWRRGWHGLLRFPAVRIARLVVLAAGAGIALSAAYHGTTPLIIVGGLLRAPWPGSTSPSRCRRRSTRPTAPSRCRSTRASCCCVTAAVPAVGAGAAGHRRRRSGRRPSTRTTVSAGAGGGARLPAAWCGAAGAIISTAMGAPEPFQDGQLMPPEFAGMKLALRTAWPLIVAIIGTLPVRGRAGPPHTNGMSPIPAAAQAGVAALLVAAMTVARLALPRAGQGLVAPIHRRGTAGGPRPTGRQARSEAMAAPIPGPRAPRRRGRATAKPTKPAAPAKDDAPPTEGRRQAPDRRRGAGPTA